MNKQQIEVGVNTKLCKQIADDLSDLLHSAGNYVIAMDDLARRLDKSPFSVITMSVVMESLTSQHRLILGKAIETLPATHPALSELAAAVQATHNLDMVFEQFQCDDKLTVPAPLAGEILRGLVVKVGQAVECAEAACGLFPSTNYVEYPDHDWQQLPGALQH